ncbi:(2Fe-2S)-binding protein [Methylophaga sp.]|uniref:(2Fe-2S)-binding protein n=1 Tax=Methylophaga sp. TaxID=2024840 RepID=UPI003F69B1BD
MIVCVCNNVNTETIHASIDSGARSVEAVREDTGAADCCGKCQFKVNRLLHEREQSERVALSPCMSEAVYS